MPREHFAPLALLSCRSILPYVGWHLHEIAQLSARRRSVCRSRRTAAVGRSSCRAQPGRNAPAAHWSLPVPQNGRGRPVLVPGSAGAQRAGGALVLEAHARPYALDQPDGTKRNLMALTVMIVNRRNNARRRFSDVTFAFQVRLEVRSALGLYPRANVTGYASSDLDAALADLHYCDVADYAVGCNTSAGWTPDEDGVVRAAHTDFLPAAEVERVEPNENIGDVEFGMEALAALAASGPDALRDSLRHLPEQYEAWIAIQEAAIAGIAGAPRQATAQRLVDSARRARDRIAAGIALLGGDRHARLAFRAMNEAVARAARQRDAGLDGDPSVQRTPRWRPFQLAFILLNLSVLQDRLDPDREVVDLLFFPTGGGKTEAYLGLAAWTIAYRRIINGGTLGAGVAGDYSSSLISGASPGSSLLALKLFDGHCVQGRNPTHPTWLSAMIFSATRRVAGSSITFSPSELQTLSRASDISLIVSGSNASPERNGRIGTV